MKIILQTFGAFRAIGDCLEFELEKSATISDLRENIAQKIKNKEINFDNIALLEGSRFANESEILSEKYALKEGEKIAIIPPVAGG